MKFVTAIAFVFVSALVTPLAVAAGGGTAATLCPRNVSSNCVLPNWGQVEPEALNAVVSTPAPGSDDRAAERPSMEARRLPVAAVGRDGAASDPAIRAVASPTKLFEGETARLLAAIANARFDADGRITRGEAAIASAAEGATKRAGRRYRLTLYVKVPADLEAGASSLLDKRLQTLNAVLSGASRGAAAE